MTLRPGNSLQFTTLKEGDVGSCSKKPLNPIIEDELVPDRSVFPAQKPKAWNLKA